MASHTPGIVPFERGLLIADNKLKIDEVDGKAVLNEAFFNFMSFPALRHFPSASCRALQSTRLMF